MLRSRKKAPAVAPLAERVFAPAEVSGQVLSSVTSWKPGRPPSPLGSKVKPASLGRTLLAMTTEVLTTHCPGLVRDVRGEGLLIVIEFAAPDLAAEFMIALLEQRVITSYSLNTHTVLRLTPPAVLDRDDLCFLESALTAAARNLARGNRTTQTTEVSSCAP